MSFNNYYVGTTLDSIGANMSRDRGYAAQQAIAQAEARQRQAAMLQQALLERQRMAQQQQQFGQEMALRQGAQGQQNQYQNALLALRDRELQGQQNGFTPRDVADNNYRYAALANQLAIAEKQMALQDPRLQVERERQKALEDRELQRSQEDWDYNKVASEVKAGQYNALMEEIEKEAKEKEKRQSFGFDDPESRKIVADKFRKDKYQELLNMLPADKRPGDVTPNPITRRFEPVLPPRRGGPVAGSNRPLPGLGGGAYQFNPVASTQPAQPTQANTEVTVRASDGSLWKTTAAAFAAFKQRDPGAQMVNLNSRPTPPPAETPSTNAAPLINSLYGGNYRWY